MTKYESRRSAKYQNSSDTVNIITPSMECSVSQSDIYGTIQSLVGDLCLAECLPNPTLGPSSHPTRPLSSSSIHPHKPLLHNKFGQVTAAHVSSVVATEPSQSPASLLEELSPTPTLKKT
ncbi:hypothetical protein TNCV_1456861 [Trichonephila clavipes]|nr:hypothetical protein TNCV_1456861 [Trichonephila clavipes]